MLETGTSRQPRQHEPFRLDDALDGVLAIAPQVGVARHEQLADGVVTGLGQLEAEAGGLGLEEIVRDLHENAGAVADQGIGADGAAMLEVFEDMDGV